MGGEGIGPRGSAPTAGSPSLGGTEPSHGEDWVTYDRGGDGSKHFLSISKASNLVILFPSQAIPATSQKKQRFRVNFGNIFFWVDQNDQLVEISNFFIWRAYNLYATLSTISANQNIL